MTAFAGLAVGMAGCGGDSGTGPPTPEISAVELTADAEPLIAAGDSLRLIVTARSSEGAPLAGRTFVFTSSASGVASVSGAGIVRGHGAGTALITATAEGKSASLEVVVREAGPLPEDLRGLVSRLNLTIGPTEVLSVDGDLVIRVDRILRLEGTLVVPAGVDVTLFARDSLIVTGDIVAPAGAGQAAGTSTASQPARQASSPSGFVMGSGYMRFEGAEITVGSTFMIAAPETGGDVRIFNAFVSLDRGQTGTVSVPRGQDGSDIEIGTVAAREAFGQRLGESAGAVNRVLLLNAQLIAGQGGRGLTLGRANAREGSANQLEGEAGDGGTGGDVRIQTAEIAIDQSSIRSGEGGRGGMVDLLSGDNRLKDGSGPNGEGESAFVTSGTGGSSGNVDIIAERVLVPGTVGAGGPGGGGHANFRGGNGRNGGAGGDLTVFVGDPGSAGTTSLPPGQSAAPPFTPPRLPVVLLDDAGNGGISFEPGRPGGAGGRISVFGPRPNTLPPVERVNISNVGNGGLGYDGCAASPLRNGTNGGPGGIRSIQPPTVLDLRELNFSGGSGGPGLTPGAGGPRGTDQSSGQPIGEPGLPGVPCPRSVILTFALGPFAAGSVIDMTRIQQGTEFGVHVPNCGAVHLHAATPAGITIDGLGPFPDPAPSGCGYGSIVGGG